MENFDVAVALFIFKRGEKAAKIMDQISKVKPFRVYLIGDGPRNDLEKEHVENCRKIVEEHITWDCEVVRYYADVNRGVYENIAGGAKWVLEREPYAIFLEDDNYPAVSFFYYCKEMLCRYISDSRILWICGTNYLAEFLPADGSDYVFTQLMLPCGWASWSHKFARFYDGNLDLYRDQSCLKKVCYSYKNKILLSQNLRSWELERSRIEKGVKPISWDFQMAYSLRVHNLVGIAPKYNLIKNIGDDNYSTHGTSSMKNVMTRRFCYINTKELSFPLKHPKCILVDPKFEKATEQVIIQPFMMRMRILLGTKIKKWLHISSDVSISKSIKSFFKVN